MVHREHCLLGLLLGLAGCVGDINPSAFGNFSTRVEQVGVLPVQSDSTGWVYFDPGGEFYIARGGGASLDVELFSPPLTGQGLSNFVNVPAGTENATTVVVGKRLLSASRACCTQLTPSTIAGISVSVERETAGQSVTFFLDAPAKMQGVIMAAGELMFVQLESPPGLAAFDISDPASPTLLQTQELAQLAGVSGGALYQRNGETFGLAVAPQRLLAFAAQPDGTVTLGAEISLVVEGEVLPRGFSHGDVEVMGEVALVTDVGRALHAVDVSDPMQPELIESVPGLSRGLQIGVVEEEGVAAVANGVNGVALFDVTDPTQPRLLNRAQGGRAEWLFWRYPYLYTSGAVVLSAYKVFTAEEL